MNEDTFLAALRETPGDELTWLALADWLEEDGQSQRAELVRIVRQVRPLAARKPTEARLALECRVCDLLRSGVSPAVPVEVNALGMRMVSIEPGTFLMGSPRNEPSHQSRERQHRVTLTRAFALGEFPVTQGLFERVTGNNPSHFRASGVESQKVTGLDTSDFPVEGASWDDARRFCARLTQLDGKHAGRAYRLPTEAEWEYACRAGGISSTAFAVGARLDPSHANINPTDDGEPPGLARTCPVGRYAPNALGLYDLHGQVWEWCSDWLGEAERRAVVDPAGVESGTYRILRGGNWLAKRHECRTAYRGGGQPQTGYNHVGFRVAYTLPEPGEPPPAPKRRGRKRTTD